MAIEEIIRLNADKPVEESIAPIATSLAGQRIFLASDQTTSKATQPTTPATTTTTGPTTGPANTAGSFTELVNSLKQPEMTIEFMSGKDAEGRVWAHAYTSEAEFDRAFPQGHHSTELSFRHFFRMIEGEAHFGGIRLNPGSNASYAIPRQAFETVKELLRRPTAQR